MFNSIVVAFDGSVHAGRALKIGAELANWGDATLGIIFVIDSSYMQIPEVARNMGRIEHPIDSTPKMQVNFNNLPAMLMNTMAQAHADTERSLLQYADFLLEQATQIAQDLGAKNVLAKAVVGSPAEAIAAYAKDCQADLVVTGSRGFGKIKSLLLGSTSTKLGQLVECSCLTVK